MSSPEAVTRRLVALVDAADEGLACEEAAAALVAALEATREAGEGASLADSLAFALLHSLSRLAQASRGAAAHIGRVLELLSGNAPPRDALALFLEALALWPEDDTCLRAQLVQCVCGLCLRQRHPPAAASHALPSLVASTVALLGSPDGEAAASALRSTLALACVLSGGADEVRARRLQLRVLGTLGGCTPPEGASSAAFLELRIALAAAHLDSWAALRRASQLSEPPAPTDEDDEEEEEEEDVLLGAGLLAHAWLSLDGAPSWAEQSLTVVAALAQRLLAKPGIERAWGGRLVSALARRLSLSGGCGDESALGGLLARLCDVLLDPQSTEAASESFCALGLLLDVATPWTRLRLLRQRLQPSAPADAVAALLFARLQMEVARGWGSSPFGTPVALQLPSAWLLALTQQTRGKGDVLPAECADAAVGALNALRFCLLRAAADGDPDVSGWRQPAALAQLRCDTLEPLVAAAARSLQEFGDEDVASLLALQTLLHCATECAAAAGQLQHAIDSAALAAAPAAR